MSNLRSLLWLAVGAAVVVAGWLLVAPLVLSSGWQVACESPQVVGDSIDPFAYAGGGLVRPVGGSALVRITGSKGTVRLSIESSAPSPPLSMRDGSVVGRKWELHSSVDRTTEVWFDTSVNGNTGLGERRLPETVALLAGEGRFDLIVDRSRQLTGISGFWTIAHAVRQEDGSIRQRGLVFSPLLRDKTGFSDPDRLELTLLLYEDEPGGNVLFQVVFSDVVIERSPEPS